MGFLLWLSWLPLCDDSGSLSLPLLFPLQCCVWVCGCFFSSSLSKLSAPTSDRSNSPRNFDLLQLDRASFQPLPGLSQFPLDPAPTSPLPACPHLSSQLPLDLARLRFRFTPASPFLQLRFDPQLAPPGLRSAILPVSSAPSIHPACFFACESSSQPAPSSATARSCPSIRLASPAPFLLLSNLDPDCSYQLLSLTTFTIL